jgi:deoxyribodipyrimidine photolyase-related protein
MARNSTTSKKKDSKALGLILGNQLFPTTTLKSFVAHDYFMAEDHELCTHFKYHKHKILLFLIAMRRYRDELIKKGYNVIYRELPKKSSAKSSYMEILKQTIKDGGYQELVIYEIEDKFFEEKVLDLAKKLKIKLTIVKTPFFLVSREEFRDYVASVKKPFMKTFYERLRKKHGILMEKGKPCGGKFSFDSDNRNKLPAKVDPPPLKLQDPSQIDYYPEVCALISQHFSDHPGKVENFWAATSRKEALSVLDRFIKERLPSFGTYQDAITSRSDFVFHSVVSPYINMGLLLPEEVIAKVEGQYHQNDNTPLNAAEGFIRQVLGWREFVRGIYQEYDEIQQTTNYWKHQRKLTQDWYEATTGIPPLDDAIEKAVHLGYNHHIERLMVVSNLMLLSEIHPQEVYRWFMELFIDSSDWVMGPNVFGMGQFSDGGIFATKPYICGSNYLLKMSDYKKGPWCVVVDGLYWRFIDKHKSFFSANPRLGMMVRTLEKMDKNRKKEIFAAADEFLKNKTGN